MVLSYYIGLLAGGIFFIDAWGPTKEGTPFLESRRFRGLSIILAGGIITPLLDYINKDQKAPFFLSYLTGCVHGWLFVFLLCLCLFAFWKITRNSDKKRISGAAEISFILLDFVYLGIADNPHLNTKRSSDIIIDQTMNDVKLAAIRLQLKDVDKTPRELETNPTTADSLQSYVHKLLDSKLEKNYNFFDWLYKGMVEYNREEYERTIAYIKNALDKNALEAKATQEDKAEALLYLALSYDELRLPTSAWKTYDRIIEEFPNFSRINLVWFDKATSLCEHGQHRKAQAAFERSLKRTANTSDSFYADAYYNAALNFESLKNNANALDYYRKASELTTNEPDIWLRIGEMCHALGRPEEALEAYEKALTLRKEGTPWDGRSQAWYGKAEALQVLSRNKEAIAAYQEASRLEPADANILYNQSILMQEEKDFDDSLSTIRRALKLAPENPEFLYLEASILDDAGDYKNALAAFEQYAEMEPEDADVQYDLANTFDKLHRKNEALAAITKSLKLNKRDEQSWNKKGEILESIDRWEEALAAYDEAVTLKPDYAEALYNKGTLLSYLKRYNEASTVFDAYLIQQPKSPDGWYNKGTILEDLKDYPNALKAYDKSLNCDKADPLTWYSRGILLGKMHRTTDAAQSIAKAKELDPDIETKAKEINRDEKD